jgi:general secretion pathway protein M
MITTIRQRILLLAAVLCLAFAAWQWGVVPAMQYKQALEERSSRTLSRLNELLTLRQELEAAQTAAKQGLALKRPNPDFTLFSFLEQLASKAKVKDHIQYMKPSSRNLSGGFSEDLVQMRLEGIHLAKLIRFLASVEDSEQDVFFKRVTIRSPKTSPGVLRADLVAGMYRINE